jgi:outer membrane protein, heavy metal efflux system
LRVGLPAAAIAALVAGACALPRPAPEPLPSPPSRGLTLAAAVATQSIALDEPLSGEALAAIAVLTNPDLSALRSREKVAEAQVFATGLYPDPSFSAGLDKALDGQGLVTALAASLGLDFAALIRRPAARRQARAGLETVRLDVLWSEWLTGEQARLLAVRVAHLEKIKGLTGELRQLAEEELARALRAVLRGDLTATELGARRLAASDASARDRSAESQLATARLDLNRLLGLDPAETVRIAAPPESLSTIPPPDVLFRSAVGARTDLSALRAAFEGSESALDAALLSRYPLPALAVNAARDTGGLKTFGPSVSFILPAWNRGTGEVAVEGANRAQLAAEYAARLEAIRADIAIAVSTLEITRQQRDDVEREIDPLVPRAAATERAAERGDLSLSAAVTTRMALIDKQIVAADLAQSVAELEIALEIACGQPLEATE